MPDNQDAQLDFRPFNHFERFDTWMAQLERLIPDPTTHAVVLTALEEAGRDLDVKALAAKHRLDREAVVLIRRLARFGDDRRRGFYAFGSVRVATIAPSRAQVEAPTTYLMVSRRRGACDYWWIDSGPSGFGTLGVRSRPLTLREAVTMIRKVIMAQARWDVIDGADRCAYALANMASLRISSRYYPRLSAWYRWSIHRGRRPA